MYSVNDFVYSMEYGIGCITAISDGKYTVKFENRTVENVNPIFITEINNNIVSSLKSGDFQDYFNYQTVNKGRDYYLEDKVDSIIILGNRISGNVKGNYRYSTSVSLTNNSLRATCDCPVGRFCKHSVAILFKAQDIINKLDAKKEIKNTKYLSANIINLIDKLDDNKKGYSYDVSDSISFLQMLNNKDYEFIKELFEYINNNYRNIKYGFSQLKRLIYFNSNLQIDFYNLKLLLPNNDFFKFFYKDISKYKNIINSINDRQYHYVPNYEILDYYIAKADIKSAITTILKYKSYDYDIFLQITKLIEKIGIDDDIIESYVQFINNKRKDTVLITNLFFNKLSKEKFLSFYNKVSKYLTISFDKIVKFPKEMQISLLKSVPDSNEKTKYILDNIDIFLAINEFDSLIILSGLYQYAKKTEKKKIFSILSNYDNAKYLLAYCKMIDGIEFEENEEDFDSNLFFKCFTPLYEINDKTYLYDYSVRYKLVFFSDVILDIKVDEDKEYSGYNKLNNKIKNSLILKKIQEYFENNDEEYLNTITHLRKELYNKEIARQKELLNSIFDEFNNEAIVSYTNEKVRLIPRLLYSYYDEVFQLSFKVGIDKFYIVKNSYEFLNAVNDCEVMSYGKGLSFNHSIENFDDNSKLLIEFLNAYPSSNIYGTSRQYLNITQDAVNKVMNIYKNKTIFYNDKEYIVRLNDLDISIDLDENNILHCNYDFDSTIITKNDIYIINDNFIDRAKTNNNNRKIYSFAIINNNLDISLAKNRFKDEIYYRYKDFINISDKIKDEYKIIDVDINAYFDYNNGVISVHEKLIKDNVELNPNVINGLDLVKYNNYKNYLKNLGFVNDLIPDKDMSLAFLSMDFTNLKELCNVFLSDSIKSKILYKASQSNIRIIYNNNMISVFLESSDFNEEELRSILKSLKRKKKYVLLKDDRIIDLADENIINLVEAINDLGLEPENIGNETEIPIYQVLKLNAANESLSIDEYLVKIINEIKEFKNYKVKLPNVNAKLRGYQYDGFKWLSILSKYNMGGILADDMGLGKTLQIITLIASDEEQKPSIIVCPKSLIFNWINEFSIFSPDIRVLKIFGNQQERANIINDIKPNEKVVYITSYDSLRNDIALVQKINFNYAVIDEAQYIKNVQALKSKNVKLINASHRFALTGTPIENNVLDLWSIFDFIMPKYFEEISTFKSNYLHDERYTERISKMVAPFILRRTKKEVLKDLPSKFERIISAEMSVEQRKLYDAIKLEANEILNKKEAFQVLPYLTRLRQICVDPSMYLDNFTGSSGKMEMLKDIIKEYVNDNHKILLFSSFVKALDIIKEYLDKEGISYLVLTGDTKAEDRIKYANAFNNNSNIKIFLISLKAGGTGLNLIGADTVIHLDPWWNVSAENQATDRAHRIGQTKNVEVIKMVCEDSIEQRVIELQNIKKDIVDKIISNDDTSITGFNLEDIGFILR